MLKNIALTNFTAFADAEFDFSKGINVIIGANSVGKSHLLKLGYTLCSAKYEERIPDRTIPFKGEDWVGKKLLNVFNVEKVGRLVRRKQGLSVCECAAEFYTGNGEMTFSFSTGAQYKVKDYQNTTPESGKPPICIPPKELLSIYPGLAQAIEDRELAFDHVYYDLCKHLSRKPLRGKRLAAIADMLDPIEKDVLGGGRFFEENGHFFFARNALGNLEAPLVAEGLCKVGMLAHLLRNGSLMQQGTLFWDEPESNLNPQLLRLVAKAIFNLAGHGIQIVVATHSLFLMREIELLNRTRKGDVRFFGLTESDDRVRVSQGHLFEEIDTGQSLV